MRTYEAGGSVDVKYISPKKNENADDIWTVYVFFAEYTVSKRGKLLKTDMKYSREVITYYF